jgi:hypothetical protein
MQHLTATLLPASLKAKMKNLISTLEKEQQALTKKRTQSMHSSRQPTNNLVTRGASVGSSSHNQPVGLTSSF